MRPTAPAPATAALTQFVLKVHSRCDLACDHCYVYEHADQSWRRRPPFMDRWTVRQAAERIAEHAAGHGLADVRVVLHGGEPLLVGAERLHVIASELRAAVEPVARLDLRMQSNGVRLTPQLCEVLVAHDIRVGISLDGDQTSNDRHRRYANGGSSYAGVLAALALLRRPEYRRSYGGILCTIDIRNDPIAVYEALLAQEPPRLEFLLPHATWDTPPPGLDAEPAPYAAWLLRIFRRWSSDARPVPIRFFDSVLATGRGEHSGTEALGLEPVDIAVIETDGAWEQADSLKVTVDGGPVTGLDIFRHSADQVAALPQVARRRGGLSDLSATCRACPVVRQCGGGLFAHRYRAGNGFDNPSVYCADLKELIMQVNEHQVNAHTVARVAAARPPAPASDLSAITDAIASGGDEAAVDRLAALQLSMTRMLVAAVAPHAPADGWQLLQEVEAAAPAAVEAVLSHPYIRAWAVTCLRTGEGAAVLNGVAAAAAIRGGLAAELVVPVQDRSVYLPSLGVVDLAGAPPASVVLSIAANRFELPGEGVSVDLLAAAGWTPTARVEIAKSSFAIEDSDPYRDCHQWKSSGRLDGASRDRWRRSLQRAWRLVQTDAPGYAPGLAAALRAVTPITAPLGHHRSSTSRHAFGAVALAEADDRTLAELLVHELQHTKLAAVLDLVPLVDRSQTAHVAVGWRPEPRPIEAALHGAYAHLAVADVWRVRAGRDLGNRAAGEAFRMYHGWASRALEDILASGALTPEGERFVELMAKTMDGWQ